MKYEVLENNVQAICLEWDDNIFDDLLDATIYAYTYFYPFTKQDVIKSIENDDIKIFSDGETRDMSMSEVYIYCTIRSI